MLRALLWALSGLLVLAALGWTIFREGGREELEDDEFDSPPQASPPLILRGFHLEEFDEEGKHLDLWSRSARFSRDKKEIYLQEIRITWAPEQDKPAEDFELHGREGTYDLSGRIAVIQGDVEMFTWNGYILRTDMVRYDYRHHLVEGPGEVRIEGPEGITDGVGLRVDLEKETFVLQEQVRTLIRPSALEKAKEDLP